MNRILRYLETASANIAQRTASLGQTVRVDASVLDRSDAIALQTPGLISANQSARIIKARDGWIAVNLPREDDLLSVPALVSAVPENHPWLMLTKHAPNFRAAELVTQAELLGLAIAQIGETPEPPQPCATEIIQGKRRNGKLRVIDFSSLWAGPLCGAIFANMGADVVKLESLERPDSTAVTSPILDQRLNGAKQKMRIALSTSAGAANLIEQINQSDVLITSGRARALNALGLTHERILSANPELIWVAITGHGWNSNRIAFGDDAAASGGLVQFNAGEPHFLGDAIADPLTGLAAADAALAALQNGRSAFIDAALSRAAAYVAALRP